MADHPYSVLFLCTGNSARSIMAESILTHWGRGNFQAFSAGSAPKGEVHPVALELLKRFEFPTEGLRSKSWNEFAHTEAPSMDFVFTVCDKAAKEICPVWPGKPITAYWGTPDPAAVEGDELHQWQAFRQAFRELEHRIKLFISLPIASLDALKLQREVDEIGRQTVQEHGRPIEEK